MDTKNIVDLLRSFEQTRDLVDGALAAGYVIKPAEYIRGNAGGSADPVARTISYVPGKSEILTVIHETFHAKQFYACPIFERSMRFYSNVMSDDEYADPQVSILSPSAYADAIVYLEMAAYAIHTHHLYELDLNFPASDVFNRATSSPLFNLIAGMYKEVRSAEPFRNLQIDDDAFYKLGNEKALTEESRNIVACSSTAFRVSKITIDGVFFADRQITTAFMYLNASMSLARVNRSRCYQKIEKGEIDFKDLTLQDIVRLGDTGPFNIFDFEGLIGPMGKSIIPAYSRNTKACVEYAASLVCPA